MGKSKKKKGTPYIDYFISMHYGICHGPVEELVDLVIKEKSVFDAGQSYIAEANFDINKPDLFGGPLREGGAIGQVHWLPGTSTQNCPAPLAERLGDIPDNLPAFRDLATIFFYGNQNTGARGFEVSSNQPNLPAIWTRVRRPSRQLPTNRSVIPIDGYNHSNPISIIYEVVTDPTWGMNGDPNMIDVTNWSAVADVLADEDFGITLTWTKQTTIEDFVQLVLDHVNGALYFNPFVGKLQIKLFRNDYDVNTLQEIGPDDAELVAFRRPLWGETVNEMVVRWTDPKTKESNTVTYQDLANIEMQGQVVSDTRDYPGARNEALASLLCARELASASSPLATATIIINRRKTRILPGEVFKFTWPRPGYDIEMIVMRAIDIDWGSPEDSKITVKCIEDIFGTPLAAYMQPEPPAWEPPGKDPDAPVFDDMEFLFRSIPYSMISQVAGDADEFDDSSYNQIVIGSFMLPDVDQTDVVSYEMYRSQLNEAGEDSYGFLGEKWPTGHALLEAPLGQAVISVIDLSDTIGTGPWPREGAIGMLLRSDTSAAGVKYGYTPNFEEHYEELVLFEQYLGNGQWRIRRGIFDTVPLTWATGDRILFITDNYNGYDTSERFADQAEDYRFLLRTSLGVGEREFLEETTRVERPYLPYRPANVLLGMTQFGTEDQSQDTPGTPGQWIDDDHVPRSWVITVTWANRNRTMEDSVYLRWDDGDMPVEPGQTTEIIFMDAGGEVSRITGLTGTSYSFDIRETTGRLEQMRVKVVSRRDGFESLQGVEIDLKLYIKGFGSDWGYMWGGWPELE